MTLIPLGYSDFCISNSVDLLQRQYKFTNVPDILEANKAYNKPC